LKFKTFNGQKFFILWLINPFFSALLLLRQLKKVQHIGPYLLLSFFFGFSFVIPSDSGADSARYKSKLKVLHNEQISFTDYFVDIFSENSSQIDLYQPVLTWLVSLFTGNYQWLFGIYALVFGYFWFKSILLVRKLLPPKLHSVLFLVFLVFILINPIWSINGARMWTAVQVFFYGLLLLHIENNKRGYIFLLLPLFIHFSLVIALILYVLYRVLPTKNFTVLYGVYIFTLFAGELDLTFFRENFDRLPVFLQSRKSYLSEGYGEVIALKDQSLSIHIQLYKIFLKYSMFLSTSWIFFKFYFRRNGGSSNFSRWFALALFFSTFSNLASQFPSGSRFTVLSNLLVTSAVLWFLSQNYRIKFTSMIEQPIKLILLFIIVVQVRIGLDYIGIMMFVGNPLINIFVQDTIPLITFVKAIF
jgi:hypothetical protein